MLILFETPAGYALFKCLNEKGLKDVDNIYKFFESEKSAKKTLFIFTQCRACGLHEVQKHRWRFQVFV